MEESKYYTPELEEFHVGFEYEIFDGVNWRGVSLSAHTHADRTKADYECLDDVSHGLYLEHIRVKFLDREDIESLGWKALQTKGPYSLFIRDGYEIRFFDIPVFGNGKFQVLSLNGGDHSFIFSGTVKNKSELKKLMKMLGI